MLQRQHKSLTKKKAEDTDITLDQSGVCIEGTSLNRASRSPEKQSQKIKCFSDLVTCTDNYQHFKEGMAPQQVLHSAWN